MLWEGTFAVPEKADWGQLPVPAVVDSVLLPLRTPYENVNGSGSGQWPHSAYLNTAAGSSPARGPRVWAPVFLVLRCS